MDKSWMHQSRLSDSYQKGVDAFLEFAFKNANHEEKILCPCVKCVLVAPVTRSVAFEHLLCNGFLEGYTKWVLHGEMTSTHVEQNVETQSHNEQDYDIDMQGILSDAFGQSSEPRSNDQESVGEEPNEEAKKFYSLLQDAEKELYPGCKSFTKLSFIIQLYHIKCLSGWSNVSFGMLLELLKKAFPEGETLPNSFYETKKLMRKLGLGYKKIDACPNDCILYRKEYAKDKECCVCHTPRTEAKVLRHFPLKPRLQRLFMSPKTAALMTWHNENHKNDGCMIHPSDSPAWKTFDHQHTSFSSEPRNIRLALASDGMNPFKTLSVSHSTWPVILVPYNLPPWMCMKQPNFIMSLLIPGPEAPGNNIDVYLQPLIEEFEELWEVGVETFDASKKQNFSLRAALLWTISDFPAYANLSGWSTKGKYACPNCHEKTCSHWLKHGKKFCYLGHRRWLDKNHAFRSDEKSFDGTKEKEVAPIPLNGFKVLDMLAGYEVKFGKKVDDNPQLPYNWKKRSIFFKLPYWKDNLLRHNLDVMHIEKNVCESVIGTLLNLEGKSKDNLNSRLDLKEMGIRWELHPRVNSSNKTIIPPACFTLKKEEKKEFCKLLKEIKVPDGYAANISRCIDLKQQKIFGLKSHDCHVLMQQLLPLALRAVSSPHVRLHLTELSNFFREIYSKNVRLQDLMRLEKGIVVTLCNLEKIFPPSFFDIMPHLLVHLAAEARIAGPSRYRNMYPIERYLSTLKSYTRNRNRPEGCIAEGYIADECLTFCSRYMEGVETKFNRKPRNYTDIETHKEKLPVFQITGRPLGKRELKILDEEMKEKAHRYVLFNSKVVDQFIEQHEIIVTAQNPRLSEMSKHRIHSQTFPSWFESKVEELYDKGKDQISKDLRCLARGPNEVYTRYKKYLINGFRFHTKEIEEQRKTQNSGVVMIAKTQSFASSKDLNPILGDVTFYGILTDIIELDYSMGNRVVLFKCQWMSRSGIRKEKDCTIVNFSKLMGDEEPFILASQAEQVMYVEDLKHKGWHVAIKINPRDFYDMNMESNDVDVDSYLQTVICNSLIDDENQDVNLVRTDMPDITVDTSLPLDSSEMDEVD